MNSLDAAALDNATMNIILLVTKFHARIRGLTSRLIH